MFIEFKCVRWKNFLSTGNAFNEQYFNDKKTLYIGKNGSGKSTVIDALVFALFNRAYRNIKKPLLINSVNGKSCIVEVEFSVNSKGYKVIRGMKPNIFEIWEDGVLINQDSDARDYQAVLERQILKLNYKTFSQVMVIGRASYVPFMQLPLAQRREIIEDLLDIRIFSNMNSQLKTEMAQVKDDIVSIDNALKVAKSQVDAQNKLIAVLEGHNVEKRQIIQDEIDQIGVECVSDVSRIREIDALIVELDKEYSIFSENAYSERLDAIRTQVRSINADNEYWKKVSSYLDGHDSCESCFQCIDSTHKEFMSRKIDDAISKNDETLAVHLAEIDKLTLLIKSGEEILKKSNDLNHERGGVRKKLRDSRSRIESLKTKLSEFNDEEIYDQKSKLKDIANRAMDAAKRKNDLVEIREIQSVVSTLLKDDGIKTSIIKEYLPIFNNMINHYLSLTNLYIDYQLDETFSETIKSRYRDGFTYFNFSEGEKQRIDLALMFTFVEICKLKNSMTTNLLILDEIFDQSIDSEGVDVISQLLANLNRQSLLIISHNPNMISCDIFDDVVEYQKQGDFSIRVKESRFI